MATDLERLVVRLEASLTGYEKQMKRASSVADGTASKIERRFNDMNQKLQKKGADFLKGVATGAVAGIVGSLNVNALREAIGRVGDLSDFSTRVGIAADKIQELRYASEVNGGSIEAVDEGLQKFAKNISDAGRGTGDLMTVLKANGVALQDTAGNLRPTIDLFGDYANLVANAKNPQDQLNLAILAFGKSAGPQLVGLLQRGKDGVAALTAEASKAGVVLGNDVVAAGGELNDKLTVLEHQLRTTFEGFAVTTAPLLIEGLTNVNTLISQIVATLDSPALKKLDGLFEGAQNFVSSTGRDFGDATGLRGASLALQRRLGINSPAIQAENKAYADFESQRNASRLRSADADAAAAPAPKPKPTVVPPPAGGQTKNELERATESVTKQTAALLSQTTAQAALNPLVDDYGFAVDRARITQELLTAAQEAGIKVTPDLQAKIDGLATGYANASVASEQLAESQEKIKERADAFNALGKEVVGGFIDDLKNGKTAAEAFEGALDKILNKLLDMSLDSIFSSDKGGGLGGIIAGLFKGFAKGGVVRAATGGAIAGRGTGTSDSIPAMLSNGEYVVSAKQTAKHRALLDAINGGGIRGFAAGGLINPGRAIGSGAAGAGLNLQIITPPGVAVGSQESRPNSRGGRDMIVKLVQQTTLDTLSNGSADAPLAGRFGARPRKIV